jgi:cysteine-rich repeat protein
VRRASVLLMVLAAACVESRAVPCGDDLVCAEGTVCRELTPAIGLPVEHRCVRPAQLDACASLAVGDACGAVDGGRCYPRLLPPDDAASDELVCLAAGCGNGRVDDDDEQCDDLNAVSGDGCSADCRSDETCGNGVTDVAAGEQCDGGNVRAHDGCSPTCTLEVPRWTRLRFGNPGPRHGHTLVATDRGRAVLFGGDRAAELLDDTWEWDGQGWRAAFPSFHPPARAHHMSAYDPRRGRVVVFGGTQDQRVWEWDGTRWTAFAAPDSPPMTTDGAMAYDPGSGHIVLFGGVEAKPGAAGSPGLVAPATYEWRVDGVDGRWASYTQPSTGNFDGDVPAQAGHVMATDPMRGTVVLVGHAPNSAGIDQTTVWEYAGAGVWTPLAAGGPAPREHATLAFDPRMGELVLSGGTGVVDGAPGPLDDAWAWNGTQWRVLCESCGAPRTGHATTYDPVHGLVSFGGADVTGDTDTAYELTMNPPKVQWAALPIVDPTGNTAGGVAATDRGAASMILWHGSAGLRALSTSGWTAPTTAPPFSTRSYASLVYDPIHQQDVLFGGLDATPRDETFTLARDPDGTWTWQPQVPAPGEMVPAARAKHAATWLDDRMVMFGGDDGVTKLADLWTWSGTWSPVPPSSPWPAARDRQAMASDEDRHQVVMFGGVVLDDGVEIPSDDTWAWNGTAWTQLALATHPARRVDAAMARDPGTHQLILFGGDGGGGTAYDDTWVFDGTAWHLLDLDRSPPARSGHVLVPSPDGRGVILFGGGGSPDVWRLRWESAAPDDSCSGYDDGDGDGLRGCADDDCWATCAPLCPPATSCPADAPRCGDGTCSAIESCRTCAADCGACPTLCGDHVCDAGEACPGDCP